jgi:UDP-N-acetylglucosamine acyltransferase
MIDFTMAQIHPTAIVDPAAQLGEGVSVGPYSIVGPQVVLGDGVELKSHVVVDGKTTIGQGTRIFPFASIGMQPQDLKYKGEESVLEIGEQVIIREHVTVNPGTEGGGMITRVGSHVMLAIGAHVAHDCIIGDYCLVMNHVLLGGHVVIGDHAVLGGGSAVHQFARIGKHAMIGGLSGVENDVIPFGTVMGNRARLEGLNILGMKRRGFNRDDIHAARHAYKALFLGDEGVMADRIALVKETYGSSIAVQDILAFIEGEGSRRLCRPSAASSQQADGGDAS